MLQDGGRDIDQRGAAPAISAGDAAAGDEQKRALLVSAEAAMLAKAGGILGLERVAHDMAVARHAVRIGPLVGPQGQCDLRGDPVGGPASARAGPTNVRPTQF